MPTGFYKTRNCIACLLTLLSIACSQKQSENTKQDHRSYEAKAEVCPDTTYKTIHVFVALCDNKYQGIVPVPASIGNGQDPHSNLYWGCENGIRSYFKKSSQWKLVKKEKLDSTILERLVFKHATKNYYLVADAYDGRRIKTCTREFLQAASGLRKEQVKTGNAEIGIYGHSTLLAYIGHDGLMDFSLTGKFVNTDNIKRDVVILACYSKKYFSPHLAAAHVDPLVWTTGLMCPEAYTLHDALTGYLNNETHEQIRNRAAAAYAKYQRCSVKAARNVLVSGW